MTDEAFFAANPEAKALVRPNDEHDGAGDSGTCMLVILPWLDGTVWRERVPFAPPPSLTGPRALTELGMFTMLSTAWTCEPGDTFTNALQRAYLMHAPALGSA